MSTTARTCRYGRLCRRSRIGRFRRWSAYRSSSGRCLRIRCCDGAAEEDDLGRAKLLTCTTVDAMVLLSDLRRYAIARSLFEPTTLKRAIKRLGFVQADPILAPARAQDLTLRQRVAGYRAGDLERLYARLGLEEDFFVNYGFMP